MKTERQIFLVAALLFSLAATPAVTVEAAEAAKAGNNAATKKTETKPLYNNGAAAEETRQKNMETIRKFLELDGAGDTNQFFAEGGSFEQTFPFYGDSPTRMTISKAQPEGSGQLPQQAGAPEQGEGGMPELTIDWKFYDETVYYTNDPDYIIIENYGTGKQLAPTGEYVTYSNHYFHTFRMEKGLIKEYREITNPLNLYKAFGIAVGHMPTPDETMQAVAAVQKAKAGQGK